MKKAIHRFRVYGSDDARLSDFTRWFRRRAFATKAEAWADAKVALNDSGYRFVKIVEERVYKGKD